jgi:hypothetical protein
MKLKHINFILTQDTLPLIVVVICRFSFQLNKLLEDLLVEGLKRKCFLV